MNLEHYIGQLLYRHQCVTVQGFGAFLTQNTSAFLNENSNTFYAPKKVISFNANIKNNDGLLANHLALNEKITYENAVSQITNEVNRWMHLLETETKITIKNIGDFSLNSEKNIVFSAVESVNYLKESYGLSTFVSPTIKREVAKVLDIVEDEFVKMEDTPVLTIQNDEEVFEEKPVVALNDEKRKTPYLRYAAVFAIGLAGAGYFGYNLYTNKIAEQTVLVQTSVQQKMQQKIQEATFFIENPLPAVTLTIKGEKLIYHIVSNAFRDEKNATKACNQLVASGYKASKIGPNKYGLYPVLYGSFATLEEAKAFQTKIQNEGNPDAWILVKEL